MWLQKAWRVWPTRTICSTVGLLKQSSKRYKLPTVYEPKPEEKRIERKQAALGTRPVQDAEFLKRIPTDDCFVLSQFPEQPLSLDAALAMHRQAAAPCVLDNNNGVVLIEALVDLRSKKKTKPYKQLSDLFRLPHLFEAGFVRNIAVFSGDAAQQKQALQLGAVHAGGKELIQALEEGTVRAAEFNMIVATPDIVDAMVPLKRLFVDVWPTAANGRLSENVADAINVARLSVRYASVTVYENVGKLLCPFGRLAMPDSHLRANVQRIFDSVAKQRPASLGRTVLDAWITCPPSIERFRLDIGQFAAGSVTPVQQTAAPQRPDDTDDD